MRKSESPDLPKHMDRKSNSREPELTRSSRESSETSSNASVGGTNKVGPKEAYFRPIHSYVDEGPGPAPSPSRCYGEEGPGPAPSPTSGSSSRPGSGRMSHSPMPRYPSSIPFYSGNPAVERVKGVLHLYKDKWVISPCYAQSENTGMQCFLVPAIPSLLKILLRMYDTFTHYTCITTSVT